MSLSPLGLSRQYNRIDNPTIRFATPSMADFVRRPNQDCVVLLLTQASTRCLPTIVYLSTVRTNQRHFNNNITRSTIYN
eukprot:scaffold25615_cov45-Cyclotella_meneghiniana.AAC.1